MRLQRIAAVAAFLFAAAFAAHAQDKPCPAAEAAKAEKAADMSNNFSQLLKAFKDYGHCDKGQVYETFTDAILRLAVSWNDVKGFSEAMKKDAEFSKWVYAHLKSPGAKDDRYTVYQRAKAQCPAGQEAFCNELAEAVKDP